MELQSNLLKKTIETKKCKKSKFNVTPSIISTTVEIFRSFQYPPSSYTILITKIYVEVLTVHKESHSRRNFTLDNEDHSASMIVVSELPSKSDQQLLSLHSTY